MQYPKIFKLQKVNLLCEEYQKLHWKLKQKFFVKNAVIEKEKEWHLT